MCLSYLVIVNNCYIVNIVRLLENLVNIDEILK